MRRVGPTSRTCHLQLGLRTWLESQGHEYLVSDDKEGTNSFLHKNIHDVSVPEYGCSVDVSHGFSARLTS